MLVLLVFLVSFLIGFGAWINLFGRYHLNGNNVLKVNSWHFRYVNWIISPFQSFSHYDFKSLCSYSWFLFVFITLSPIFLLLKTVYHIVEGLGYLGKKLLIPVIDFCDKQAEKWLANLSKQIEDGTIPDSQAIVYGEILRGAEINGISPLAWIDWYGKKRHKKLIKLFAIDSPLSQKEIKENILKRREEILEKQRRENTIKQEAARKRQQQLDKLVGFGKWIVGGIGAGITFILLYYLFIGLQSVFSYMIFDVDWSYTLQVWKESILIILKYSFFALVILIIGFGIASLLKWLWCGVFQYCIPCKLRRDKLLHYLSYLNIVIVPFIWLGKGLVFTWRTIKAYKTDNCPMIVWEEE